MFFQKRKQKIKEEKRKIKSSIGRSTPSTCNYNDTSMVNFKLKFVIEELKKEEKKYKTKNKKKKNNNEKQEFHI